MIGGKPNHAHWFIGYVGKYMKVTIYWPMHEVLVLITLGRSVGSGESLQMCRLAKASTAYIRALPQNIKVWYCRQQK